MNCAPFARLAAVALLVSAPSVACVTGVAEAPARTGEVPAPLPEIRSAAPNPGMVWVPGAWHRDGAEQVWIPGRWAAPLPVP